MDLIAELNKDNINIKRIEGVIKKDVFLNIPLKSILGDLIISDNVKDALLGKKNILSELNNSI